MSRIFDGVAGNHPALNRFDLSYTNTTSMSIGYLYPLQCDEVYPGSVWKMKVFCHAEVMPLVAPLMSDLQIFAHVFFVPFRLLYGVDAEDGQPIWEKFITGGKDGDYDTALPSWHPSFTDTGFSSKKIWDYIGNPMEFVSGTGWSPLCPASDVLDVSIAPKRAYNFIVNSFYRDEDLQSERSLDEESLFVVSFKKDYFTSALESQQRGTAPAMPVDLTGSASAVFTSVNSSSPFIDTTSYRYVGIFPQGTTSPLNSNFLLYGSTDGETVAKAGNGIKASVDLSNVGTATFTPSDMRLAFAIQRMQELAMRSGYRYTEWLSANFAAHPTDARLDRPEYIGGCVIPISISPLMQTSGTEGSGGTQKTPQGNKSGVGKADAIQKIGNYRVLEHGLIMTMVSIRPKPIYQQGINRQWLRQTRFDFYNPALAYLSEFGIYNAQLYVDGKSPSDLDYDPTTDVLDNEIFGYQAAWNEMRCKQNMVTGAVREQLSYYAMARKFANRPHLNSDFIQIKDSDFNHVFAVQNEDEFVVSWSSLIDAYLPIPEMGVPGLVDHVYGGF